MDAIVLAMVEEICAEGPNGVSLMNLWAMIEPSVVSSGMNLCEGLKQIVWSRLLSFSELRFETKNILLSSFDGSIQSFEDSERLDVKVVADENLRDNFLGIYEQKLAGNDLTKIQRRLIDRIAFSRTKGVTQNKLSKEFNMKGNEIFYHLKNLEYCRLIVRHSTLVKTEGKNDKAPSVLNTNLVHLHRYAKDFNSNSQQRIEITMEEIVVDGNHLTENGCSQEEMITEDISVKDFLPALEAVCNKLEKASGKVLIVKDMKIDLGYRETKGHRAWRNIVNRLKEANLVEEVTLKVSKEGKINNEKCVLCLRLLKKFDPKDFQPKTLPCGYNELDSVYDGKKGQINEQIMELSISQQIYDMVNAGGVKGMTINEICTRLGLRQKKYHSQIIEMCSKYEMHIQAESHNRTKVYRFWTIENFKERTVIPASSGQTYEQPYSNALEINSDQNKNNQIVNFIPPSNKIVHSENDKPQISDFDKISAEPMDIMESGVAISERSSRHLAIFPAKTSNSLKNPCLELTTITTQRKNRILFRLERDKFLLWADMQNWLQSLEIEKTTKMARRTLLRIIESLEKDGLCKRGELKFPSLNNRNSDIIKLVVLHPSVTDISAIVGKIYRRVRDFDRECRRHVLVQSQSDGLIDIERSSSTILRQRYAKADAMRANGFIPAKMVRIKLLHRFLWSYLSNYSDRDDPSAIRKCENVLNNNQSPLKLFAFDKVVKDMPVDLFLRVVGSVESVSNMVDNCQKGLKLSDLAVSDFKQMMDTNATGRLSSIVDVLLRLKLIHLVTAQTTEDAGSSHTQLCYAMELKPHIEVPRSQSSLCPRMRHDFVLSTKELVDEYWQSLEYHYATADPKIASRTFPGSIAPEVFARHSWSLVRLMSTEQRIELRKRVENIDPSEKVSFKDSVTIAKELDLTLSQVLRAFYDKKRQFHKFLCKSKPKVPEHLVKQPHSDINVKKTENGFNGTPISDSQVSIQSSQIKSRKTTKSTKSDRRHANLELEVEENDRETFTFITQSTRVKSARQRKFWDYESDRLVRESLSIANAVEIIKLHFLSSSSATELQSLLKETLRWYSEMDLCAAFTYLSQKNFLVKEHGSRSFVLSKKFLIDASSSPFPIGSGKRATKFSSSLFEPDKDFTLDFQCGETFHLFALISSGKLAISICLPDEGIGGIDESSNLKSTGNNNGDESKQHDFSSKKESDYCLRREKGFPGIKPLLNHLLSGSEPKVTFNCCEKKSHHLLHSKTKESCHLVIDDIGQDYNILSKSDAHRKFHFASPSELSGFDLHWQEITIHAKKLSSKKFNCGNENLSSHLIKSVYISIKQSGEQGLDIKEISQTMTIEEQLIQVIVDTLEAFHLVMKVNAYNCIHIVDSFYKSKYFITMLSDTNNNKDLSESGHTKSQLVNQNAYLRTQNINNMKLRDGHTITILDVPNEAKMSDLTPGDNNEGNTPLEDQKINDKLYGIHCISQPILPWINGDGGVNSIMYKGLVRRVFGIIMQNPGIIEDHLFLKMEVINPQSCRQLLSLMIADKHIYVKSISLATSCGPSKFLQSLFNPQTKLHNPVFLKHFYANPMSTGLL